jgi:DNA invertase Pin-like site-specific DNA recombinase
MDTFDLLAYDEVVESFRSLTRCALKITDPAPFAYSYLRFSSSAQADGDSVRRQTALRDGWLKRHPVVRLDTSLSLVDAGVSGYRGEHRTNGRHALASFVDLVRRGRVPAGSFLIVENLDRLTRENPVVSIPAVLELISLGVRVVQLAPVEIVYDAEMDQGKLMFMLWELARGHGESKRKSGLCGEAWMNKKQEARDGRKAHGKAVPAWLELAGGAYRVKEDAGRAVRRIFQLSAGGLGTLAITARLNAEKVRPIGRADVWHRSYVAKVLDNRAVLGEYQPMKGHRGRVADGDPVPGYFPAVITETEWDQAHGAKLARNNRCGRPGKKGTGSYVFQGLLRCALDDCALHVITRRGVRYLVSARAVDGEAGSHWRQFPLEPFVEAVLSMLREVTAADIFQDQGGGKVAELTGRLAGVEKRLAVALERFEGDPESPTWSAQVTKYDREKRALVQELAEARRQAANPLSGAWAEAVALMGREDPVRLRQALLETVAEVRCVFVPRDGNRLCACQVWFAGGERHRDYIILSQPPKANGRGWRQEGRWWARSLADTVTADDLDLRQPKDVQALEAKLQQLDQARLAAGGPRDGEGKAE